MSNKMIGLAWLSVSIAAGIGYFVAEWFNLF
jgi:hypothetical protein